MQNSDYDARGGGVTCYRTTRIPSDRRVPAEEALDGGLALPGFTLSMAAVLRELEGQGAGIALKGESADGAR